MLPHSFRLNYYSYAVAVHLYVYPVTKTPKFHHITPILKSHHWLKLNERIKYKVLSLSHI